MEKLNAISEFDEVLEITGKYIGGLEGGYGTSSDLTDMNENENEKKEPLATSSATVAAEQSSLQSVVQVQRNQEKDVRQYPKSQRKQQQQKSKYQIAIFTAIGIVGAIALTGFIISGVYYLMLTKIMPLLQHKQHQQQVLSSHQEHYMAMLLAQQDFLLLAPQLLLQIKKQGILKMQ